MSLLILKKKIIDNFPKAFDNLAGYTPGLTCNFDESEINKARTRLSVIGYNNVNFHS